MRDLKKSLQNFLENLGRTVPEYFLDNSGLVQSREAASPVPKFPENFGAKKAANNRQMISVPKFPGKFGLGDEREQNVSLP